MTGNLQPFVPPGWAGPLVVNAVSGSRQPGPVVAGGPIFVNWAHRNAGPQEIAATYHVDLYVNGVLASRWTSQGASTSSFSLVTDWAELPANVRLDHGAHKLALVLDPLNEVAETDEADNRFEIDLTVGGEAAPPIGASRKADLAIEKVVVTSYAGYPTSGPLSVDVPTHIQYSLINQGLTSVTGATPVHIYVDGILVRQDRWKWVLAGQQIAPDPWAGLLDTLRLTPGEHEVRVVVDPGNVIDEADETNNHYTATFAWGEGPVPSAPPLTPAPAPTAPAPLTAPNLVPGWRFGTDGPIVLSSQRGTAKDGAMVVGQRSFVDVTVFNESAHAADAFAVDLFFDGGRVRRYDFRGGVAGGHSTWQEDWDRLLEEVSPGAGRRTLRIVIDPDNAVAEANEDDNVYEKVVTWYASAADVPLPAPPTTYSDAQARDALAPLASLLDDRRPVAGTGGSGRVDDVLAIADAGYFLMTGESFLDADLSVRLLSHAEYAQWIDRTFASRFATAPEAEHPSLLERREQLKTKFPGHKTRYQGQAAIFVDAERPFGEVLGTLMHELGHARQDFLNPAQTDAPQSHALRGIQEAGAQEFERAFWLTLEAFTGTPLLRYPAGEAYESVIDDQIDDWLEQHQDEEHSLGYLLQWVAPLADSSLRDLGTELTEDGALSAVSALKLYDHFVSMSPSAAGDYVAQLTALFADAAPTIRSLAKRRLAATLPPDAEASADLRTPGLLMP